jgi:hypothetical protein
MSSIRIPGTFSHEGMSSSGAIPVVSEVGTKCMNQCMNQRMHRSRDWVMTGVALLGVARPSLLAVRSGEGG